LDYNGKLFITLIRIHSHHNGVTAKITALSVLEMGG
jgi:hypothetical protein